MVLDRKTVAAADEIELEELLEEEPAPLDKAKTHVVAGVTPEIKVVEEYNIKAAAPAAREKKLDDDDWFKQAGAKPASASARTSVKEKNSKSGNLSKSERSNSRAMASAKGSARMQAAKPAAVAEPEAKPRPSAVIKAAKKQDVEESVQTQAPSRKSSRRMAPASGRQGPGSRNRIVPMAKKAAPEPAAVADAELVSEPPEAPAADDLKVEEKVVPGGKMSSRTFKVDRRSAKAIRQQEREDRDSRRSAKAGRGGDSNMMMIGLGVGAVVLLLMIVLIAGGGGGDKAKDATKKAAPTIENPGNPSEFAARAKQKEDRGDRLGAADDYQRAAEASGNSEMATQYNMHAYQLRKFTTLNMGH